MKALCSLSTFTVSYRHNCLVVYRRRARDWWRKSYWVVCIYCDEAHGPHRAKADAWRVACIFNDEADRRTRAQPAVTSLDARRKRKNGDEP